MAEFQTQNPDFEDRIRKSFNQQQVMHTLGGTITSIKPGFVTLELPFNEGFTQQHGFLHAGVVTTMLDSAAGYAAFSLMPVEAEVLTVELKTSLMAPAKGERFRFQGKVIKPGRTITFCEAEAFAFDGGIEKKIASLTATMMAVTGRDDIRG